MKEPDHAYIARLVMRSQKGDSDAFAEIYAMTYNKVYNYACHYLRDTYLAQDAVQEIYISALKNIHKIKEPTLFIAWMNQISFHVCFDICKKNNEAYGNVSPEIFEFIKDEHVYSNPEAHLEQSDETARLLQAINALPLNERQVIIMKYYNNLKLDVIADALAISKSTVKRYLANGQKTLLQLLEG
ncbi:MAG: RNA polymerase sigma factor [Lachnospiraceae bacterium]|nr:RNA polymerase sigma factor [Lachnospiraceae bacterium]